MIITKTPFRISFAGGRTDVPAYYSRGYGAVLSTTIDKYVYVTLNRRFDDRIQVSYDRTEIVDDVDDLKNEIAKACLKTTGLTKGIDITTISEIPYGTGLGSSSSFTVGLLNALYCYLGQHKEKMELASLACDIEIAVLGHPVGKQDQYAASIGGINFFTFNADGSVVQSPLNLSSEVISSLESRLMMFYTGIRRDASQVMDRNTEDPEKKLMILDYLRDQAVEMRRILESEGFSPRIAEMLDEGWAQKKAFSKGISNDAIDIAYERAKAAGALGGRLLGAGGGGFLLLYCEPEKQDAVRREVGLTQCPFKLSRSGTRVVYNASQDIVG
ncbi:MAG: GHMP kinase [Lachnospiraceae bacterium]|nr:GHMP kinase [Lachnospiraceae bacterium]